MISRYLKNNSALALVLSLLVMTVLFMITSSYYQDSVLALKRSSNLKNIAICRGAARSGLAHGIALLRADEKLSGAGNKWYQFIPGSKNIAKCFPIDKEENIVYQMIIEDQDGKINLNNLLLDDELIQLFRLFGFPINQSQIFRDSLLDWIDTNHEHRLNGKEDNYYQGLNPRYHCKNSWLDSLEEIFLIHGLREQDETIFFGANPYGYDLRRLTTVMVGTETAININTACKEVLQIYLQLKPGQIQQIQAMRNQMQSWQNIADAKNALGLSEEVARRIKTTSQVFRIKSLGRMIGLPYQSQIEAMICVSHQKQVVFLSYDEK